MSITNEEEQFKKLSHDLLVYLTHLEETYVEIEESEEKVIIDEWLQWILKNPNGDLDAARIRNMALSKMLMDIGSDKLQFPFNERPSDRSFTELVECLKTVLNQNALLENEEHDETLNDKPENRELDLSEFENTISNDTRTYIALRTLPNSGGVFGYVAITMGDGPDTQWLDSKGQPIPTPVPGNLRVEQIKKDSEEEKEDCELSDAKLVWNVLQDRRALCLRIGSLEFYKTLYNSVEQEMLAEKSNRTCSDPFINKLLKFLEIDLKAIGITDLKIFCRLKMLSILKKQIKAVISEIKRRTETLSNAEKCSTMSPIFSLPTKCCYNFVSSTLWNEIYKQQPAKKYMDILSKEYPKYFFPKYFSALLHQKKQILSSISRKYCNIMDEMFADLGNSITSDMKRYRDSKWEWHLAHEIIDAYKKEKAFKDSLCVVKNSADEMTDPFLAVILNEIEMAQDKLRSLVMKNDKLAAQLPELRNEISDVKRTYQTIVAQNEEKICKLSQEINNEKRDIIKRTNTIAELELRVKELNK